MDNGATATVSSFTASFFKIVAIEDLKRIDPLGVFAFVGYESMRATVHDALTGHFNQYQNREIKQ